VFLPLKLRQVPLGCSGFVVFRLRLTRLPAILNRANIVPDGTQRKSFRYLVGSQWEPLVFWNSGFIIPSENGSGYSMPDFFFGWGTIPGYNNQSLNNGVVNVSA